MKRNKPTHSENPIHEASSSSTSPHVDDYEGGTKKAKEIDYEVFLSFKGEDTCKDFADYLYTNIVDAGICVFRHDNELCVGEEIGPELLCTITQCKISIPIISEDYATSKWCLRDLAQILKCKRSRGQIVLPIFYKVEPLQLQHLAGRWRDAINAHKQNLNEMIVKEWEEALKEVSSLKGWECEKISGRDKISLVKTVVRKLISELRRLFVLNSPELLVGVDDRVAHIMSSMDLKFSGTRIIGIYGMGGIGKTTLAKLLYNKLSSHFESRSFMANIGETSRSKGIVYLQKELIYDILRSPYDVSNVKEGINVLKSRCIRKKVLILLDDIDNDNHVNALIGDGSWFKAGSIVFITTRDKSILNKNRVAYMYLVDELPLDQSLILFTRHAFRRDSLPSDYEFISRDIVSLIGGLPLYLEVIASFLCGQTKETWKDTIKRLRNIPDRSLMEKLKICFGALDYEQQQIFLDIACFFIGSSKQIPTYMWDDCGFFPNFGLEELNLMSLIKIDEDGKLMMHDLLRDIGREITRLENLRRPEKRSRLWAYEEAAHMMDRNKGTSTIEALCLVDGWKRRTYTSEQFKELTNLRFLKLGGVNLAGDFQNLLPELRWLQWEDCPSDLAMTNFHPMKLVVFELLWSDLDDWASWGLLKMAPNLKVLSFSHCRSLRRTLDMSSFKSLEILILEDCENLEEIHPSIKDIKTLISLNVIRCSKLENLPAGVGRMEKLRELILDETAIQEIPISTSYLMKLKTLSASNCGQLTQLPESMGSLTSLTQLNLSHSGIEELPESMGSLVSLTQLDLSHTGIEELPESVDSLVSLTKLDLSHSEIEKLPESMGSLVLLTKLDLSHSHIEELPESMDSLVSLTQLDLSHSRIEALPESIGFLQELKTLDASNCEWLACIPNSIDRLGSLQCLLLRECRLLTEIPVSIGKIRSLTKLDLKSTMIAELPDSIGSLKELETLDASYCAFLACLPNSIGYLESLSLLDLRFCGNLAQLPDSIGSLVSLKHLLLQECRSLKEIPDSIGNLASLIELNLKYTAIARLPESIGYLKELVTLDTSFCASLACIPSSIGHLAYLSLLDLRFCPKLAQLPDSIGSLKSLRRLLLRECRSLRNIPDSIGKLASLIELDLKHTAIAELPKSIEYLQKLRISSNC